MIECTTVPGIGGNLSWVVDLDGQRSVWAEGVKKMQYKRPVILSSNTEQRAVTGNGVSDAQTSGGEVLIVQGEEFGPANEKALMVTYGDKYAKHDH